MDYIQSMHVLLLIGFISGCAEVPLVQTSEPLVEPEGRSENNNGTATGRIAEESLEPDNSLVERLASPQPNLIVMESPSNESTCVDLYEACECFRQNAEWLCFPTYHYEVTEIDDKLRESMEGKSWRPDCPIELSELRLVSVMHWSNEKEVRWGEFVVAAEQAQNIADVFKNLYLARFIVPTIVRIDHYDGNDDISMAENNSSAFNCRKIKGTEVWSQHSYGTALDINPLWNPWTRENIVDPPGAIDFVDRSEVKPGMIGDGDVVVRSFTERGWKWGGHWVGKKDYQHFSVNGR